MYIYLHYKVFNVFNLLYFTILLLFYYYFIILLLFVFCGEGVGGTYESPFTPHKWAKEKIPQVWQQKGTLTKGHYP